MINLMKRTREICRGCTELVDDPAYTHGFCWFSPGEGQIPDDVPDWCLRLLEYTVLTQDGESSREDDDSSQ